MTITHDDLAVNRSGVHLSPALLEANRCLHELRAKQARHPADVKQDVLFDVRPKQDVVSRCVDVVIPPPPESPKPSYPQPIHNIKRDTGTLEMANRYLHVQRNTRTEAGRSPIRQHQGGLFDVVVETIVTLKEHSGEQRVERLEQVLLHPSIAVALLKAEKTAVGRLWLLARSLDPAGSGRINIADLRTKFTAKESEYRVCGWRRMRILFGQGDGLFWERDNAGRLWLFSTARVAAGLGLTRLEGLPVFINIRALCNIQSCRAQLYASWFSGRVSNNPISRSVLTELTGQSEAQQRIYESIANVTVKPCIALGDRFDVDDAVSVGRMQECVWKRNIEAGHGRGGAVFEFIDHKGQQGEAGARYIAWHLPNQYIGCHRQASRSGRRNVNKRLKRIVNLEEERVLGNDDSVGTVITPLFYDNMKQAAQANKKRNQTPELYWRENKKRKTVIWYAKERDRRLR